MKVEPQKEHEWLMQMVGEWTFEGEASMAPDKPPEKFGGTERTRSIGGIWIVSEGQGEVSGGANASMSLMTLGYDPQSKRFVGTFIASMLSHLWRYDGALDATRQVLTLDTEGPSMLGDGMTKYRDVIEIKSAGLRVMRSEMLGDDGKWKPVMTVQYRRQQ